MKTKDIKNIEVVDPKIVNTEYGKTNLEEISAIIKEIFKEKSKNRQMINFSKQHPNDIITRALVLEQLKSIPPQLILQLPVEYHKFVKGVHSTMVNTNGVSASTLAYNWEYALFEATLKRLIDLMNYFNKVDTAKEAFDVSQLSKIGDEVIK